MLASPTNSLILRALSEGPKQQTDLRRAAGSPAQTTLRAQLRKLCDVGAIERHRRNSFPGVVEHELTDVGAELFAVSETVERWLQRAPAGPVEMASSDAKAAIKALAEGWSSSMLRALGAKPLTLTELDSVITTINYPSLERRLAAMKLAGQVKARSGNGRGTPYGVTDWTREAVGPLAAAARWERRHLPDGTSPIGRVDVEAAFLLAVPLLSSLETGTSGSCRCVVDVSGGGKPNLAGILVGVDDGQIDSCTTRAEGYADAWVSGTPAAWLAAVIEADFDSLELGGDCRLAKSLLEGLHRALFSAGVTPDRRR